MISALIFDCDGTLTNSMPVHFVCWRQTMARHGIEFDEQRFYALGGVPSDKIVALLAAEAGLTLDAAAVADEATWRVGRDRSSAAEGMRLW